MKLIRFAYSGPYAWYEETVVDDEKIAEPADEGPTPEELLAAREAAEEVFAVLTPRQRDYLRLLVAGYTYKQIAERQGVTRHMLRTVWYRIRKRLRKHGFGRAIPDAGNR